ncbi:PRD domain-containing protein [Pediococcus acidilactici]
MLISQVLNNNVILVKDGQDCEKIVWGRGIGFKNHAGQDYKLQPGDKVFTAVPYDDRKWIDSFKELSTKIPREYFELTEEVIQIAKMQIDVDFDEHLLISLADHIYFAVERFKLGLSLKNPMLPELKRFFTKEYQVGKYARKLISQLARIPISDDEAGFIAIHLVEHEIHHSDNAKVNFYDILEISTDINNIIKSVFGHEYSEDSITASRLMAHLHYLIFRSATKRRKKAVSEDTELLNSLKRRHRRATECLRQIVDYLEPKINYTFTDSDRLYLLIHIVHITS